MWPVLISHITPVDVTTDMNVPIRTATDAGSVQVSYWRAMTKTFKAGGSDAISTAVAVHSGVFADNPASLKLQQKLGFEITGCSEIYSFARNTMVPHIETMLKPGALRLSQAA